MRALIAGLAFLGLAALATPGEAQELRHLGGGMGHGGGFHGGGGFHHGGAGHNGAVFRSGHILMGGGSLRGARFGHGHGFHHRRFFPGPHRRHCFIRLGPFGPHRVCRWRPYY